MNEQTDFKQAWWKGTILTRVAFFFLIALGVLCGASAASASDIYVAQGTTGGANGADCSNARAVGSLGSSDWAPGNTIHLCGTITSTITGQGSGTSSSVITLKFEPGAGFSVPALSANGQLVLTGLSNITVDGGGGSCGFVANANVTCNGGKSNFQSTSNGTGLGNQVNSIAIMADSTNNVTVQGLFMGPIYVHNGLSDTTINRVWCVRGWFAQNLVVRNNTMHDASWCIDSGGNTSSSLTANNNEIYHMDHGVAIGNGGTNINIYSNHFHDFANWDTSSDTYHHDGIHLFGASGAFISNVDEHDNVFDGDFGNNTTSWIYNEMYIQNARMYNNYASTVTNNRNSCCGIIDFFGNGPGSNNSAYNNTVVGAYTAGTGTCFEAANQSNVTIENNIFIGCQNMIGIDSSTTIASLKNNVYEDLSSDQSCGAGCNTFSWHGNIFSSFATWVSSSGETGAKFGTLAQVNLSAAGRPQSGSIAIGAGLNLTSLGIANLNLDIAGTPRPSGSTAWDSGAYASGGTATAQTPPAPPTNLKVVVQ